MNGKKTEEKVFSYMEEYHMVKPHDNIVAGVSGGADSVCLLFVLLEYAKRVPLSVTVVHVNHGIRKEAFRDARYVERLCREHNLPFYLEEADVRGRAAKEGLTEEEAGRKARYEAFSRAADQIARSGEQSVKIAVAHQAGDRAETLLFHLFRGSGIKGLGSIRPVRDNIIRPLLCLERKEIEEYLQEKQIDFCQDLTNEGDEYTRNRIRHHILPYAEKHICRGAVRHICQSAELLAETEDYLDWQTDSAMEICVQSMEREGRRAVLSVKPFLEFHPALQKRVLLKVLQQLSPGGKDIASIHVELLRELFTGESGRSLNLPFGMQARREYERILIEERETGKEEEDLQISVRLSELSESPLELTFGGQLFTFQLLDGEEIMKKNRNIPQNQYTKWFDCDKIKESLILRTRRQGDYFTIRGADGSICHKLLKDYMITEKIPGPERKKLPLLAAGSHVLWLAGYRISEAFKINEYTKHILQVQLREGAPGERRNGG